MTFRHKLVGVHSDRCPFTSPLTEEQEFDERLIAKIVAAAEAVPGINLDHGLFGVTQMGGGGLRTYLSDGAVCAVGAGILYKGLGVTLASRAPLEMFAEVHGVSTEYAYGVSNGYEGYSEHAALRADDDYARGVAVGEAVRAWAEDCEGE